MRFWKLLSITVLTSMLVIPALADINEMRLFRTESFSRPSG